MALDLGAPPVPKKAACSVQQALNERPDDADALVAYLRDPDWTCEALSEALADQGIEITRHVIGHHRRNKCAACVRAGMTL